jgi:DNA-binding HxlR family transcriptional regulator
VVSHAGRQRAATPLLCRAGNSLAHGYESKSYVVSAGRQRARDRRECRGDSDGRSDKRHFRELLQSDERISSNILADRLARLVEHGLLTKSDDPTHKQKAIYSLTEKAIALLPIVVQIGAWGSRWVPDAKKLDRAARKHLREIQQGGPPAWAKRMDELRAEHL